MDTNKFLTFIDYCADMDALDRKRASMNPPEPPLARLSYRDWLDFGYRQ